MTDSDINKYTIEFMSSKWIISVACVIALIFIVLYVGHKLPASKKETYNKFFLMDKTYKPSNIKVTKKLRELFGIEKMGGVKSKSIKSKSLRPSLQMSPKSRSKKKSRSRRK